MLIRLLFPRGVAARIRVSLKKLGVQLFDHIFVGGLDERLIGIHSPPFYRSPQTREGWNGWEHAAISFKTLQKASRPFIDEWIA